MQGGKSKEESNQAREWEEKKRQRVAVKQGKLSQQGAGGTAAAAALAGKQLNKNGDQAATGQTADRCL
jgi:hypothetical protein